MLLLTFLCGYTFVQKLIDIISIFKSNIRPKILLRPISKEFPKSSISQLLFFLFLSDFPRILRKHNKSSIQVRFILSL